MALIASSRRTFSSKNRRHQRKTFSISPSLFVSASLLLAAGGGCIFLPCSLSFRSLVPPTSEEFQTDDGTSDGAIFIRLPARTPCVVFCQAWTPLVITNHPRRRRRSSSSSSSSSSSNYHQRDGNRRHETFEPFLSRNKELMTAASTKSHDEESSSSLSSYSPSATMTTTDTVLLESKVLGRIRPLRLPGQTTDTTVVGNANVPTYCTANDDSTITTTDDGLATSGTTMSLVSSSSKNPISAWGLEGALQGHGPSMVIPNVLNASACEQLIAELEGIRNNDYDDIDTTSTSTTTSTFTQQTFPRGISVPSSSLFGQYRQGKNHHGALQMVVSHDLCQDIAQQLSRHIDIAAVEALQGRVTEALESISRQEERVPSEINDKVTKDDDSAIFRLGFVGLNRRWRIYRYDNRKGDEAFAPHIDAGFPPSGISKDGRYLEWDCTNNDDDADEIVSRLTVLMYLNDDFIGGETNFYQPMCQTQNGESRLIASVRPQQGAILIFPQGVGEDAVAYARQHWPLHEGSPLKPGSNRPKYVIRSDALFVTQRVKPPFAGGCGEEWLFQYDESVRNAFLPQSSTLNSIFLHHIQSLYNPHMGVENVGPFLYSFLRLTKRRNIVEIGAGYTTLWILQALHDNDKERQQIQQLEHRGANRLLDIEWTIPATPDLSPLSSSSSLLCIDNCLHQKETATGAFAVAQILGLDSYLRFRRGDAFEEIQHLGSSSSSSSSSSSVDVLWCDFGVGTRLVEFLELGAWDCLRPGGFFVCHSTITNQNTRNWLEKIRARRPKSETGIDPDEYAELSLLEPHKTFQNSITILQKRSAGYAEPVYSTYA